MKKGYWVVRANISDKYEYSKYIELASKVIQKYDGKFLVRGGSQKEFEKDGFERTVVVEFASHQQALNCYESKGYQSALDYVKNSAVRYVSVVEGY